MPGVSPLIVSLTDAPATGPPVDSVPYPVVVPYWNLYVAAWPRSSTVPLSVAPVPVIPLAASVVTIGGSLVVTVWSLPCVVTSAFYAYGKLSVLSGTVGITASMVVVAVAGVAFPYTNTEAWRSSPASGRTLGIPTITLTGLVALPLLGLIEWALLEDVNSGTSIDGNPRILEYAIGIFLIGLPLYYGARALQRGRGVNVDLAYKEIPPE